MKKNIFKIIGLLALTMLIALNVTSTMKFSPGGESILASIGDNKKPCYNILLVGSDKIRRCTDCREVLAQTTAVSLKGDCEIPFD